MKTIITVPTRLGSTRFPGKAAHEAAGKTILDWTLRNCVNVPSARVYLVPEYDRWERTLKLISPEVMLGTHLVLSSPDEEEIDCGTQRVATANWGPIEPDASDIVCVVQSDQPTLPTWVIQNVIGLAKSTGEMATAAIPFSENNIEDLWSRDQVRVITDERGRALWFTRYPESPLWHIGIYAAPWAVLKSATSIPHYPCAQRRLPDLEQLPWCRVRLPINVAIVDGFKNISINREEDTALLEGLNPPQLKTF
jgi:3-deoxy-manno-octulosonate cytidylyltransferase (CMP-KDO synthetase)